MKTLVLAEKPSVGRDIAKVLGCNKKINGALEGNKFVVTWALGHLVTLADPEKYDRKYQHWAMEDLPIIPKHFDLVVIGKTSKQYQAVKTQIQRKDIQDIVIATDAGREGELVARWILLKAGNKKPLKRLWISSVTSKAIKEGFAHLKDAKAYEPLYYSAYSRSVADWLVGMNASRALTCKYNASLSCGRVQTPTLALVLQREEEIKQFKPVDLYSIQVKVDQTIWTQKNKPSLSQEKRDACFDQLINQPLIIQSKKVTNKKTYSPALYDLTSLQQDANKIYGYSAKQTLDYMQSLYETHKVVTYPRTDSRYLTEDIVPTIKERLVALQGLDYDEAIAMILKNPIKKNNRYVDNRKVSDHHAIIPTEEVAYKDSMSEGERRIFDLVTKRFLAVLLPPYEFQQTHYDAKIKDEVFTCTGVMTTHLGWQQLYKNQITAQEVPEYKENQSIKVTSLEKIHGQTTPPSYLTEATLLQAMENPTSFMKSSSNKLNQTLKETGGLGTVATRADIIEKLFNSYLLEKRGQELHVTSKGKQLLQLVPEDLRKPELTAKWELELAKIANRKQQSKHFITEIEAYTKTLLNQIQISEGKFKHDNLTGKKCPECGSFLLEVSGKKGKMLVCSSSTCHYKQPLSIITNARCPNCHKKLELVGQKDKQMFVCKTCGYRESMSHFKKERETKKVVANVRDVKKYMKQQKQQQTSIEDSPFAALLKMKDDLS